MKSSWTICLASETVNKIPCENYKNVSVFNTAQTPNSINHVSSFVDNKHATVKFLNQADQIELGHILKLSRLELLINRLLQINIECHVTTLLVLLHRNLL